jgi:hypothetical protein
VARLRLRHPSLGILSAPFPWQPANDCWIAAAGAASVSTAVAAVARGAQLLSEDRLRPAPPALVQGYLGSAVESNMIRCFARSPSAQRP